MTEFMPGQGALIDVEEVPKRGDPPPLPSAAELVRLYGDEPLSELWLPALTGPSPPRYFTLPTPGAAHRLGAVAETMRLLGSEIDHRPMRIQPWQALLARVATEFDPATGIPTYRNCHLSGPRQIGKTLALLALMILWCQEPGARILYSAQSGQDTRRRLEDDFFGLLKASPKRGGIDWESAFEITLRARNPGDIRFGVLGSAIVAHAGSEAASHGGSFEAVILDECWAYPDDSYEAAARPTIRTRPRAQLWRCSTFGEAAAGWWWDRAEDARKIAVEGRQIETRTMVVEWSAADRLEDLPHGWQDDDELAIRCNPGYAASYPVEGVYGIGQIRDDRLSMPPAGYARAVLNVAATPEAIEDTPIFGEAGAAALIDQAEKVGTAPDGVPLVDPEKVRVFKPDWMGNSRYWSDPAFDPLGAANASSYGAGRSHFTPAAEKFEGAHPVSYHRMKAWVPMEALGVAADRTGEWASVARADRLGRFRVQTFHQTSRYQLPDAVAALAADECRRVGYRRLPSVAGAADRYAERHPDKAHENTMAWIAFDGPAYSAACGMVEEMLRRGELHPDLSAVSESFWEALTVAKRRSFEEGGFRWSIPPEMDDSALMAVTLAVDLAQRPFTPPTLIFSRVV